MQTFSSNGVAISYVEATPPQPKHETPVLLIHGFASNASTNWVKTGWMTALTAAGYRAIAFDNRGHGNSEKLYALEDYGAPLMARDAVRLLDHLGLRQAHVIGYSMGARISAFMLLEHPERVASAVFGGLGIRMVQGMRTGSDAIAEALEAPSLADVTDPTGAMFRTFAEHTGSDLRALAACMRSARAPITAQAVATITKPVLVIAGADDTVSGSPLELAALIPGAKGIAIPGRDHMKAVGDAGYKKAVIGFLNEL